MKIYTKTGDDGTTGLSGGLRVFKNHPLIEAYGTVDEINALIGLAIATSPESPLKMKLIRIQHELFKIGADLSLPWGKTIASISRIDASLTQTLESEIDECEKTLTPLTQFILPGGSILSAHLHLARTIARRAERLLVEAQNNNTSINPAIAIYLNRLSDWFFCMARLANMQDNISDTPWIKT